MSLTKKNLSPDKSRRGFDEKGVRQTSEEVNRNEERVSPTSKGQASDNIRQTSGDIYPKTAKSSPGSDILNSQGQWDANAMNKSGRVYTGNSERSGQQYSEGNSSQSMDWKHPQRKDQLDQSHGSTLSEKQRSKKSRGMNAPATDLDPTGTTTPRQRSQQNKKTDSGQEC
jgi:hypothetical protein